MDRSPDGTLTRIWVHSDLQLGTPALARETVHRAVDDLLAHDLKIDAIWCLGDALCGSDLAGLDEIARINVGEIKRLEAPLYYVLGNHEMDALRKLGIPHFPLHKLVEEEPGWRTGAIDSFYFSEAVGRTLVVFLGDHAAKDGSWWTTNGAVYGDTAHYPYPVDAYRRLRAAMERHDGPVIIASHYALPGGQRASDLLAPLLPLPKNVCLHLHGHAHIGDTVFNAENPWQRANPITGETRMQYNISALESVRSPGSHSGILNLVSGIPTRLRIRCHEKGEWVDEFAI